MVSQINEWLKKVKGFRLILATDNGAIDISETEILNFAKSCEWVQIEEFDLYPYGMILGYGDLAEYCKSCGKSRTSKAYFINAYRND